MQKLDISVTACAISLAFSAGAMAQSMSKDDYKGAKDKIDAQYAAAKERCDAQSGSAKDQCIAQAKARYGK